MFLWTIFLIIVDFGAVCLFFGYRDPMEKEQEVLKLIRGGYGFIAASFVMLVVRRLFSGFSY